MGVGGLALVGWLPLSGLSADIAYLVFLATATAAALKGIERHRPVLLLPWLLLASVLALWLAGDVLTVLEDHTSPERSRGLTSDVLYVAGYGSLLVSLVLFGRRARGRGEWASLSDTAIAAVAAGLAWSVLVAPYGGGDAGSLQVSSTYPVLDAAALALTVRLLLTSTAGKLVVPLVSAGLGAVLVADAAWAVGELTGSYQAGSVVDAGWMLGYLLISAATLHPGMREFSRATGSATPAGGTRTAILGFAVLLASVALIIEELADPRPDTGLVISVVLAVLVVLVLVRVVAITVSQAAAVRREERAAAREFALRTAAASLVGPSEPPQIHAAARDAVLTLGGRGSEAALLVPRGTGLEVVEVGGGATVATAEQLHEVDLPASFRRALHGGGAAAEAPGSLVGALGEHNVGMCPVSVRGELRVVLFLVRDAEIDADVLVSLEALGSLVAQALERAALADELHRRSSEERFRAVVDNASDLVSIVGGDGSIRYVSPSVEQVLGYRPDELLGPRATDVVHPGDLDRLAAEVLASPMGPGPRTPVQYRVRRRDGTWRHLESVATNLMHDPLVAGYLVTSRDITERKLLEEQLARQAFHDPLTGLANRALFLDRVRHAVARRAGTVAVLFCDLDDFKAVNDSLGHPVGDEVLVGVAERLRASLRPADTAARLGGDEFAVLLEDVDGADDAAELAQRLLAALEVPLVVHGREVSGSASIGIAVGRAGEVVESDLLRNADVAMYRAKDRGKGRYELFKPEMHAAALRRLDLVADLRRGLARGEFDVWYQPVVELPSGRVTGAEALLRWRHPERGLIRPGDFVGAAEETGLVLPLGRWVLERACHHAVSWQQRHGPLQVGVNLSPRQLQEPGVVDDVERVLADSGLDPALLMLEITESALAQQAPWPLDRLEALRSLGVCLALDDFGTGYSSLSRLRELPIAVIKLGRSFIDPMGQGGETDAVPSAVITLGKRLGLVTVAEGVERIDQLEALAALGCDKAQGYLFSRPLDVAAFRSLLEHSGGILLSQRPGPQRAGRPLLRLADS